MPSISLSGVSALQNVQSNTTVTFRYYASGQTGTGGWGFSSAASGTNGLAFSGTIECLQPIAYNVTGGGSYCSGGTGVAVGISNSQVGISYQLKKDNVDTGSPVAGTGAAISFGNQTGAGSYTVVATNGGCNLTLDMTGSVNVSILARPTAATCYTADLCQTGVAAITVNVSGTLANYTVTCAGVYNAPHPSAMGAVTVSGTPATIITNTGNTTFSGLPGNATYTITVTDTNGCTAQ